MKIRKKYFFIASSIVLVLISFLLFFNKIALSIIPKLLELNISTLSPEQNKTLDSLRKADDHPLYIMDYYGDYSQFLKIKGKYYMYLGIPRPECSTFAFRDQDGDAYFSRNNDNLNCPVLMLFTYPKDGYASVSIIDISFLGFDTGKKTPFDSREASTRLLYTPYFASDGMNECGLAIGDMSIPDSKMLIDPDKESMFQGEIVRYILDHAQNTDEAIDIFSKYNVGFPRLPGHFLISDPSGRSAVIEWTDGKVKITRNMESGMAAANFMLYGTGNKLKECEAEYKATGKISKDINGKSYWRYTVMMDGLRSMYDGKADAGDAMNLLRKVSLEKGNNIYFPTQWSVVYQMNTGRISIAMGRNYERIYDFRLKMKSLSK